MKFYFLKVCSNWLCKFKNQNSDVNEFISVVNNKLNDDYSKIFGLPILNVVELFDTNGKIAEIKIFQESFTQTIYTFKIPIIYVINDEIKKIDILMNEKEKVVDEKFDWIVINNDMSSLCAVNYSTNLLQKMVPVAKDKKINSTNILLIQKSALLISGIKNIDQEAFYYINELD